MALEISGKLIQILPLESGEGKSGNAWKKQFFVIEFMDGNYPKKLCVSLWGDKVDLLRSLKTGDDLKVSFNIESREYNGRWYTDVRAWRVEQSSAGSGSQSQQNVPPFEEPAYNGNNNFNAGSENDLPF